MHTRSHWRPLCRLQTRVSHHAECPNSLTCMQKKCQDPCPGSCGRNAQCSVKACVNQKCVDPCPGVCGNNARCQVTNHNPVCQCPPGYQGDPSSQCSYIKRQVYLTYLQKNLQDHKTNNENHEIPLNPTCLHSRYKLGLQVLILIHHCQSSENPLSQIITT